MKLSETFPNFPSSLKLLYGSSIFIGCVLLSGAFGVILNQLISFPSSTISIWVTQSIGSLFSFLLPALWFAHLDSGGKAKDYLGLKKAKLPFWIISIALIVCATPLVNALMEWNQSLFLSGNKSVSQWEAFFITMSETSDALVKSLLSKPDIASLICNVIVVAVLPAICEEFLFRGCFQSFLQKWTGKVHLSVWIVAIVFSLFHLDLLGFFPRLILGAVLGYTFYYSRSLLVSIGVHFINNVTIVIVYFLYARGFMAQDPESLSGFFGYVPTILSLVFSVALVFLLKYLNPKCSPTNNC